MNAGIWERGRPSGSWLRVGVTGGVAGLLIALGHILVGPAPAPGAERISIPAAVHVHSTFSGGPEGLDAIARRARAVGLQAVLFAENYALAFAYGVEPLPGVLRWRERFPSLGPADLPGYLEAVRQARRRHPDLILMPGLEVIPFYYWTGSLFDRTLTLHDGQKNLLVFGLEGAEDLTALPIVGNARPRRAAEWPLRMAPLLLVAVGAWLFRLRRVRVERWRQYRIRRERQYWLPGAALVALALLLLADGWLAGASHWNPQRGPLGYVPHQAVIDFVARRGGATVWSLPEARDFSVHRRGGLTVTVRTDPYPQALAETHGYTAFAALYWDTTTIEAPGGLWDRLLRDFLTGRRAAWPVAIAESALHWEGQAGKRLGDAQTVFLAATRTPAGVLEALRAGRAYTHLAGEEFGLVLQSFSANGAGLGETAWVAPGVPPRVALAVAASDGSARLVEVRLVRSGTVLAERKGPTPLTLSLEDPEAPASGAWYYRAEVRGEKGARLLTNPIFLRRRG